MHRAAPLLGQRLADRVADDPVGEGEVARRLRVRRDQARGGAAIERLGGRRARDARGAHEVGDREAPRDRADLEHGARLVPEPLDAPPHDLPHARRDERARCCRRSRRRWPGGGPARRRRTGCRRCACAPGRRGSRPAAARARPRGRARPAPSARRTGRPRSRAGGRRSGPRPACTRRPAAAARRRAGARAAAATRRRPSGGRRARPAAGARPPRRPADPRPRRRAPAGPPRRPRRRSPPSSGASAGSCSPATSVLSERTIGRQTPYGRPSGSPRPQTATPPRRVASAARASSTVVLPMPGSPAITTVRAAPLQACVSTRRRRSSSGPRPTSPAGVAVLLRRAGDQAVQRVGHQRGARGTVGGVMREQLEQQPVELRRHARDEARRRGRRAQPQHVLGVERPHAAQQLVERDAEREQVAARRDGLAERLLGGGVARRAGGLGVLALGDGDAEVAQRRLALGVDPDVVGLDVAVDDAVGVRVGERVGDLAPGGDHLLRLQPARGRALEPVGQRPARHVARDQARRARVVEDVVDGDDVAVAAQPGRQAAPRAAAAPTRTGRRRARARPRGRA